MSDTTIGESTRDGIAARPEQIERATRGGRGLASVFCRNVPQVGR